MIASSQTFSSLEVSWDLVGNPVDLVSVLASVVNVSWTHWLVFKWLVLDNLTGLCTLQPCLLIDRPLLSTIVLFCCQGHGNAKQYRLHILIQSDWSFDKIRKKVQLLWYSEFFNVLVCFRGILVS